MRTKGISWCLYAHDWSQEMAEKSHFLHIGLSSRLVRNKRTEQAAFVECGETIKCKDGNWTFNAGKFRGDESREWLRTASPALQISSVLLYCLLGIFAKKLVEGATLKMRFREMIDSVMTEMKMKMKD
jgi:hypothetical protein